jgi:hypothetical protein
MQNVPQLGIAKPRELVVVEKILAPLVVNPQAERRNVDDFNR